MDATNLSGRAGRWSASHWKRAALGWIAFTLLAVAVGGAVGANVIRAVLVPATMKFLGERNWYLPHWLKWLPSLSPAGERRAPPRSHVLPTALVRHGRPTDAHSG